MATVPNRARPEPVDRRYASVNRFIPSTSIAVTAPLYAGEKIVSSDTGARYVGIAPEIGAWGKLASKFAGGSSSGGFPDAATTGFTPGTTFTLIDNQLLRSTSDGQVFENLHLTNSDMIVTHDFVTIRNCWFDSAVANNALRVYDDGTGGGNSVVIEDCTFFGHNNCTNAMLLNGALGATVSRCDISGCDNGINVGTNNCLIEDCYVHDLNNTIAGDPHYDCIEINGGLDDFVITHCTLINTQSQTSCFQLNNYFGASSSNTHLVENCKLIDGGSTPIYSDARFTPSEPLYNVTIKDCIIRPSALWGYTALVYNTINWQWINNRTEAGVLLPDPGVNPTITSIPMSYSDPVFASNTPSVVSLLTNGQAVVGRDFPVSNANGDSVVACLGNNTIQKCRFGSPYVREGIRIAGPGLMLIDQCYIYVDGLAGSGDHADGIQAYSPGDVGTIFLSNTFVRAFNNGAGPGGEGSVGVFIADNWTGTFRCSNVVFQSGQFGCRAFPDTGGDMHIDFDTVYFVGPFNSAAFDIGASIGGHVTIIDRWVDVFNATIVGGAIVPGTPIPPPIPVTPLFPDAGNTGPTAGTVFTPFSGDFNTSADGQIVEKLNITGQIIVRHQNVTIRDCIVNCTEFYGLSTIGVVPGLKVLRTRIIGVGNQACMTPDGADGTEVAFCDLSGAQNGIFLSTNNMNIHDNYIHDLSGGVNPDPHIDGIQGSGGFTSVTINHNTIISWDTSCIILQNEGAGFSGVVITNNKLIIDPVLGGAYCILCQDLDGGVGTVSNITVTGNRMALGNTVGASYGFFHNVAGLAWIGNVHNTTGNPVTPDIS